MIFLISIVVFFLVLAVCFDFYMCRKFNHDGLFFSKKNTTPFYEDKLSEVFYAKPKVRVVKTKTGHKCLNCGGVGFTNYKCDYCGSNLYIEERMSYKTSGYATSGTCSLVSALPRNCF